MKKVMLALAVVAMAAFVQAASYNWSVGNDWIVEDNVGTDGFGNAGWSVYFFDATTKSDITSALAGNDTTVLSSALGSSTTGDFGMLMFNGSGFTAADDATSIAGYLVILDGNSNFYASDSITVTVSDANKAGAEVAFAFGEMNTTDSWTKMESSNGPEPTSGLLLLLGMAGLALRRKQA